MFGMFSDEGEAAVERHLAPYLGRELSARQADEALLAVQAAVEAEGHPEVSDTVVRESLWAALAGQVD